MRPSRRARLRRRPPPAWRPSWPEIVIFTTVILALLAALGVAGAYALQWVPSRYLAAYLPEPLQGLASRPHADLPTPVATLPPQQLSALLTPIPTKSQDNPGTERTESPGTSSPTLPVSPSSTPLVAPPATASPTPTAAPTPTPTLTLTPAYAPGPTQLARSTPATLTETTVLLTGFRHAYQTWNNCGPASLAMALSYFGWPGTQKDTAAFLKPDPEDRNTTPAEMVAFVRSQGYQAMARFGGTLDLLKAILHTRLPVLIEKGFEPDDKLGWMGHYLLLIGYKQATQEFIAMDSYLGPMQSAPFEETDRYWRQFNRTYIVIYRADQAETVAQLLGAQADDAAMHQQAMSAAQAEVAANTQDPFGWFNIGTTYEAMGLHTEAAIAYDHARQLGLPWRMTWYQFGWFEAYLATGRYDDVVALADATLQPNPYSEEMYYYKGRVHAARGELDAARAQYQLALQHNPNFTAARQALDMLAP